MTSCCLAGWQWKWLHISLHLAVTTCLSQINIKSFASSADGQLGILARQINMEDVQYILLPSRFLPLYLVES